MATQSVVSGVGASAPGETADGRLTPDVIAALLATYLIWGTTYLAAHYALLSFPPMLLTSIRFLTAGTALFLFLRWRGAVMPSRLEIRNAAIVGVFLLAGGMGGTMFAYEYITSGLIAISVASIPIWSALFAGLRGQWPQRGQWMGILLGFTGVGLLGLDGLANTNVLGILIAQVAAMLWSFGSVWSRGQKLPAGPMGFSVEMLAGGIVLLLLGVLRGERLVNDIHPESVAAWLYLVIFGSLIAFSSYMYLLRKVPPTLATSYAYVNPVIAVIVGAVIASERITWLSVLAMLLILSGLAIMTMVGSRRHASKAVTLTD